MSDALTLESSGGITKPIHLLDELARRKAGMPVGWKPFRYEHKKPGAPIPAYAEIEGAVAPPLKSGPRKGKPNWKAMDKSTVRTVCVTPAEQEAFAREWAAETGKCSQCVGEGRTLAGWSREKGQEWRPCRACGGSGKAAGQ